VIAVRLFSIVMQVLAGVAEPGPESNFRIEFFIFRPCSFFHLIARNEGQERLDEKYR